MFQHNSDFKGPDCSTLGFISDIVSIVLSHYMMHSFNFFVCLFVLFLFLVSASLPFLLYTYHCKKKKKVGYWDNKIHIWKEKKHNLSFG